MKQAQKALLAGSSEGGFTLLELMASMTILLIMVGFLGVAFNTASVAWRQGEHDVDRTQAARSTVDLIARDLSQALVSANVQFYGNTNSLAFVAPVNDDPNAADLSKVAYVLNWNDPSLPAAQQNLPPFRLLRLLTTTTNAAWDVYLHPGNWPTTAEFTSIVCDTVMNFTLTYYYTNGTITTASPLTSFWNSTPNPNMWVDPVLGTLVPNAGDGMMTNMPPAFINIHLEVVDSRTATLLRTLPNASAAYINLTNRAVRAYDAYVKIPQR
jgi:prepilin-type N-terminal cleavage/methylation domain-containing protein